MIPFNRFSVQGNELTYAIEAIHSGKIAGDHGFTKACQGFLEKRLGVKRALLTTSCTDALEIAAILLDIKPGDEVIVPAFTFVSTANAFVLRGATPVFCDIRPDTFNLDEGLLPSLITPKTKAIVPVHYAGVGCEMDVIMDVACSHEIQVVEDNAHGLFGTYRGKTLGTFGALATQSFHETKNISCGEGGALLVNDPALVERAEIIRDKGTNRSQFFRGEVDKYSWQDIGSSFVMSDMLAAVLWGQLDAADEIQRKRRDIWYRYDDAFMDWTDAVKLPVFPKSDGTVAHMYQILMPDLESRQRFIMHMKNRGVQVTFHYGPLNKSPFGAQFGGACPVAENIADRLVRLPLYAGLGREDQEHVIAAMKEFVP